MARQGAFNKHSKEVVGGSPLNSIATKHASKTMSHAMAKHNPGGKHQSHAVSNKTGKGLTHHHSGGHRPSK